MRRLRRRPELPEILPHPQDDSDHESDFQATPMNNFTLLQTDSGTDSDKDEPEDDNAEDGDLVSHQPPQQSSSGKSKVVKNAEEDLDWEKLLIDFKQEQPIVQSDNQMGVSLKNILGVNASYLDPQLELKRMFGSVALEETSSKKGRRKRQIVKDGILVKFKDIWPRMTKLGLSMEVIRVEEDYKVYSFVHSKFYSDIQIQFYQAVQTHSPNALAQLLHMFPYHIDSLLQLSEVCRMGGDAEMTVQCVERALFAFERAFHPTFQFSTCTCKLDFDRVENRSFFLGVFRQIQIVSRQGCWRTALEWCKLLFSLNIEQDPYGALLILDFFALKASQYDWVIGFWEYFKDSKKLHLFPNWTFSRALAIFELEKLNGQNHENSSKILEDAILTFPSVIPQLFQLASISDEVSHPFFNQQQESSWLEIVVKIFIVNHSSLWKMADTLNWMRDSVKSIRRILSGQTNLSFGSQIRSVLLQEDIPLNILRYIIVSDIDALRGPISPFVTRQINAHDPLPPPTAIRSTYDSFFESQRIANPLANANFISGLFQSLLPWVNTENLPEAIENAPRIINRQQVDEALIAAQNNLPQLFGTNRTEDAADWFQSLREALMDLIDAQEEEQSETNSE